MNKIGNIILLFAFIICGSPAFAQSDTTENPIDKQFRQCLDSSQNETTYGMTACTIRAEDAWDKELNKYYNLLVQTLSKDEKDKLQQSQKLWLAFRDSESTFSSTMYKNMNGTIWDMANVLSELHIIKHRALELQAYYSDKAPR
jgi:uncharacterized protein YecT (DUF1311 family)